MSPVTVDADPYPWPWDGAIEPSTLALVVAGAEQAWADVATGSGEAAAAMAVVAGVLRDLGATVVHVRTGGRHAPTGPRQPAVPAEAADLVVDAGGIDGFHASPLDGLLRSRGITHLLLSGFGLEAAVGSTLRSANDRGYECLTLTDACAPLDPELGARALHSTTMSGGIFGANATTAALLAALPAAVPAP